jgi:hypothetical protein
MTDLIAARNLKVGTKWNMYRVSCPKNLKTGYKNTHNLQEVEQHQEDKL